MHTPDTYNTVYTYILLSCNYYVHTYYKWGIPPWNVSLHKLHSTSVHKLKCTKEVLLQSTRHKQA